MRPAIRYTAAGLSLFTGVVLIGVGAGFGIAPLIVGGVMLLAVGSSIAFLGRSTPALLQR